MWAVPEPASEISVSYGGHPSPGVSGGSSSSGSSSGSSSSSGGSANSNGAINYNRPYFDDISPRNVTSIVDETVVLKCRVKNKGDRTVSPRFIASH